MDLRGCRCAAVVPQIALGGKLPVHLIPSARISPISIRNGREKRRRCLEIKASGSSDDHEFGDGGRNIVDADMILLRKRIYELKRQENNYEYPKEWMEWEKRWHDKYQSGVYRAVECLQYKLINARPGVGIGVVSLISASIGASVVVVLLTCATHLTAWMDR